jgi:1-acyl-sn-glycerol-3-phosphate acyltransferase
VLDQGRRGPVVRLLRATLWLTMRLLFRIEHHGADRIPPSGPLIVAPNHVTYFDPFWVAVVIRRTLRFMAWDRIFVLPGVGAFFRWLGAFPVSLENPESSAYRASLRVLGDARALMMFAEGGRSPDGRLQPLKEGVARLALRTGAAILPVAVLGGHEVWGPHLRLPRPRKVVIEYLEPIRPPRIDPGDRARFEEAVGALTRELAAALGGRLERGL